MPKLKKITPLDRQIDILEQHIKRCELELQELYALRPKPRQKKKNETKYYNFKIQDGKEFNFIVG